MKIAGLWSGHDCSCCVLEDGVPIIHAELERYIREKEPKGDSVQLLMDTWGKLDDIDEFVTCFGSSLLEMREGPWPLSGHRVHPYGHHLAHAAHAFYSSKFDDAAIVTIDGGGVETQDGFESATTAWAGSGTQIHPGKIWPSHKVNIGGLWTRVTRSVFRLQNGWPRGHQAGSVMAMAAMGDRTRFVNDFWQMLTKDLLLASQKPKGQPRGAYTGNDPRHPYLGRYTDLADADDQTRYDLAAGLQMATEIMIRQLLTAVLQNTDSRNLCLSGGVALNSVVVGKIYDWFPDRIDNVFIPPVPYDGGLSLGAAQYHWHHELGNPRIDWQDNLSPYLGEEYTTRHIQAHLMPYVMSGAVETRIVSESDVIDLLEDQKIVAIFTGRSESGRRALGNRSILADPRSPDMKDQINQKVKHRQWYRPFAPSILREDVGEWFTRDIESPYMSHVVPFRPEVRDKIPAVIHFDGTARLQSVSEMDNPIYHSLLSAWKDRTGVPILLNTSFNDREPICETVEHALNCYLRTNIDHLWLPELEVLVSKKGE